jgi:hypothetical protein
MYALSNRNEIRSTRIYLATGRSVSKQSKLPYITHHFQRFRFSVHQNAQFLLERLTVPRLVHKRPAFYEREGSLPCSQETATCPGDPNQSSPRPRFTSSSSIIVSLPLCLGLPNGLFPSGFPPKPRRHLSSLPYVSHATTISSFLI